MLSVAVVSTNFRNADLLRKLRRSTLVGSVRQWKPSLELPLGQGDPGLPDLVMLDVTEDSEVFLKFANHLRRLDPNVKVIACSTMQASPDVLLRAMRAGVQDFLTLPLELAALNEALLRLTSDNDSKELPGSAAKLVVVTGTKGGVGVSTVAVNLAIQLRQMTKKSVLLLDFARPLGDVCVLLGLQPRFTIRDVPEGPELIDACSLIECVTHHKSGLDALAGSCSFEDWQHITETSIARVMTVARSRYDFVIADLGVMYSTRWNSAIERPEILLITHADVPGLAKLRHYLSSYPEQNQVRVVVNRWQQRDEGIIKLVERKLQHPFSVRVPDDFRQVNEAANTGEPLSTNRDDLLGARFRELACCFVDTKTREEGRWRLRAGFSLPLLITGR